MEPNISTAPIGRRILAAYADGKWKIMSKVIRGDRETWVDGSYENGSLENHFEEPMYWRELPPSPVIMDQADGW